MSIATRLSLRYNFALLAHGFSGAQTTPMMPSTLRFWFTSCHSSTSRGSRARAFHVHEDALLKIAFGDVIFKICRQSRSGYRFIWQTAMNKHETVNA